MEQRGVSAAGQVGRAVSAGNKESKYRGERGSTGEQQEPSTQLRTRKVLAEQHGAQLGTIAHRSQGHCGWHHRPHHLVGECRANQVRCNCLQIPPLSASPMPAELCCIPGSRLSYGAARLARMWDLLLAEVDSELINPDRAVRTRRSATATHRASYKGRMTGGPQGRGEPYPGR